MGFRLTQAQKPACDCCRGHFDKNDMIKTEGVKGIEDLKQPLDLVGFDESGEKSRYCEGRGGGITAAHLRRATVKPVADGQDGAKIVSIINVNSCSRY